MRIPRLFNKFGSTIAIIVSNLKDVIILTHIVGKNNESATDLN